MIDSMPSRLWFSFVADRHEPFEELSKDLDGLSAIGYRELRYVLPVDAL